MMLRVSRRTRRFKDGKLFESGNDWVLEHEGLLVRSHAAKV